MISLDPEVHVEHLAQALHWDNSLAQDWDSTAEVYKMLMRERARDMVEFMEGLG